MRAMDITLLVVLALTIKIEASTDSVSKRPVVALPQGSVRGISLTTANQRTIHGFKGIPFAKPPLGSLRFEPPEPADCWSGVRDASKDGNQCVQFSLTNELSGNEDCLFINVYTPKLPSENAGKLLPVLVFYYGGAWQFGSNNSTLYGPEFLLDKDILLVTPNYRLGIFGFLSTGDAAAPGNAGLKDQVFALEWIRDYIQYFGGDPNKITIAGESAGGATVEFLSVIPRSAVLSNNATDFRYYLEHFDELTPYVLYYYNQDVDRDAITAAAKKFYFANNLNRSLDILWPNMTDFASDMLWNVPSKRVLDYRRKFGQGPNYFYSFNYRGEYSWSSIFPVPGQQGDFGPVHLDELLYLFPQHRYLYGKPENLTSNDRVMKDIMVDLWSSFVINGKPTSGKSKDTVGWKQYSSKYNHLQIGDGPNTTLTHKYDFYNQRIKFWEDLIAATYHIIKE